MAKKVHYFNIFITKEGKRTSYKLNHIFDKYINPLQDDKKLKICNGKPLALNNYILPSTNEGGKQGNRRTIAMADYRNKKPFQGKKGTADRKNIEGDVLDVTRAVIFPDEYLMVVEYNHTGCRAKGICEYIERFLPEEQDLKCEFKQIQRNDILDKVLNSTHIKSINVTLDTTVTGVVDNFFDYEAVEEREKTSMFAQLMKQSIDTSKQIDSSIAMFGFKEGRKRNKMAYKDIVKFISLIDLASEAVQSVQVKYIDPDTNKEMTKNLKTEAFIEDEINEIDEIGVLGDEFIRDEILNLYESKGKEIKSKYKDFGSLVNIDIR
ncbi:hypothetical protein HB912_07135 [Listeria aquatica]|uniref:Uncharacterized protein n=1 Tax=Listeria aquatica TaxID=1494960 RepID=A0A841ZPG4_9LIST|nr:hypothetical protein [Listeria aquatica]MBC1521417.1 hypothetical protein [Listeria aquatica]